MKNSASRTKTAHNPHARADSEHDTLSSGKYGSRKLRRGAGDKVRKPRRSRDKGVGHRSWVSEL